MSIFKSKSADCLEILKQGISKWNKWMEPKEISFSPILVGVDLQNANLFRGFLRFADLSRSNLVSANLSEAQLNGAILVDADISKANLSKANLGISIHRNDDTDDDITQIRIGPANLHNAKLVGTFLNDAKLDETNFTSADLREASFVNAFMHNAILVGANCSKAKFIHAVMSDTKLIGAKLIEADLTEAFLVNANFSEADLSRANLRRTNLLDANFKKANLNCANLSNAKSNYASFDYADISGAALVETDFTKADFGSANLSRANLNRSNLKETNFDDSNLTGVDFTGALFQGTNLKKANLSYANLTEVQFLTIEQLSEANSLFEAKIDSVLINQLKAIHPHLFYSPNDQNKEITESEKIIFSNRFKKEGDVVVDQKTGLMWQYSGSGMLDYREAETYIASQNLSAFLGYSDWRLPTLNEVGILIEVTETNEKFDFKQIFDKKQTRIWTSTKPSEKMNWVFAFDFEGCCRIISNYDNRTYARAVRSVA